jgi:hypothetical protein
MVGRAIERPGGRDPHPIRYRLKKYNGGKDPNADHPATWAPDWGVWCCDCVGFTSWCLGFDRFQKGKFEPYGGWINTDSMIQHAEGKGKNGNVTWFEKIDAPEPGCLLVTRSKYKDGKRVKVGHVGLCVSILGSSAVEWSGRYEDVMVIDCSSSASKQKKMAITVKTGRLWRSGVFLRYLKTAK